MLAKFKIVKLIASTKYIEKPIITSNSRGHVNVGENFTLNCYVKTAFDVSYTTDWKTPTGIDKVRLNKAIMKCMYEFYYIKNFYKKISKKKQV